METTSDRASSRSARTVTDRVPGVHRLDEVLPIRDLPVAVGLALEKGVVRDSLLAIGIDRRGESAHVIIVPASEVDESVAFQSDRFGYVAEMNPFGDVVVGKMASGIRSVRLTGAIDAPFLRAFQPTLEAHGPALLEDTRGYFCAPATVPFKQHDHQPAPARWQLGPNGLGIYVQRQTGSFNDDPRLTIGACDSRFAVVASNRVLSLLSSSVRVGRDPKFPEWPEVRLQPICMDADGAHLSHSADYVSAALWPGKTTGAKRPCRWYHLVQGQDEGKGKTTLVSVGSDRVGFAATFRSEGYVVHNGFARIAFLDAVGGGQFLTRDTVTGMVRRIPLEKMAFLPKEVNALVSSF